MNRDDAVLFKRNWVIEPPANFIMSDRQEQEAFVVRGLAFMDFARDIAYALDKHKIYGSVDIPLHISALWTEGYIRGHIDKSKIGGLDKVEAWFLEKLPQLP